MRGYRLPADTQGKIRVANESEQNCSGAGVGVSCENRVAVGGKKP
ncbi:hypothetical protein ABZ892_28335 [Streptomyces sp. NPDC046924]